MANICSTSMSSALQQDKTEAKNKNLVALFLYADGDAHDFVCFQRDYLDNALTKFLLSEGFVKPFEEWVNNPKCSLITAKLKTQDDDEHGEAERKVIEEARRKKVTEDECKSQFIQWGIPMPESPLSTYDTGTVSAYASVLERMLPGICESIGFVLREHARSETGTCPPIFTFKGCGYDVVIHTRFNGTIMFMGKVGEQETVFCYGNSRKYELPCTTEEYLTGVCKRIGYCDSELYSILAEKKKITQTSKLELKENKEGIIDVAPLFDAVSCQVVEDWNFLKDASTGVWIENERNLEQFFSGSVFVSNPLPEAFVRALARLNSLD